jgi:hypothetical protein
MIKGKIVLSFIDELINKNKLNTFNRTIKNQKYFFFLRW